MKVRMVLKHDYVREGDPWPIEHAAEIVHVAERKNEIGLDVWWLEPE